MIITTKPTKAGRIGIYGDGEYLFSATPDYWYSLGICEGDELAAEETAKIGREIGIAKCCAAAYAYLTRRAYSEKELRQKLARKYSKEETDIAVEKAISLGLLDDADYAQSLAEQLLQLKHYAPNRIRAELLRHGVERETAADAVDALSFDAQSELCFLLEYKFHHTLADERERKKTIAALSRMGYDYADIRRALRTLDADDPTDGEYI